MTSTTNDQALQLRAIRSERCAASNRNACARWSESALACDIRVASADSCFAITPAKLGIAYPYGDLKRVCAAIGPGQTKLLLFTGRRLSAAEAHRIGLTDVLAAEDFSKAITALVGEITQSSPYTIKATKAALRSIDRGLTADEAGYPDLLWSAISGVDFVEGMAHLFEIVGTVIRAPSAGPF